MAENYDDILDELSRYEEGFDPTPARDPGLECLDNGMYEFLVLFAELTKTSQKGQPIAKVRLRVTSAHLLGAEVVHAYVLTSQTGFNALGADLAALGLRQPQGLPFHPAIPGLLAELRGKRFRARKDAQPDDKGVVRQRLYINSLIHAGPLPAAPAGRPLPAPTTGPARRRGLGDDEIPW